MFNFSRHSDAGDWPQRGQWQAVAVKGARTAAICCPECGTTLSLRNLEIKCDGRVVGVVICPVDDCNFREFAKLEDWRPQ